MSISHYVILISWAIGFVVLAKLTWPKTWKIIEDDRKFLVFLMCIFYMILLGLWPIAVTWNLVIDVRRFVSQKFRRS